MLGLAFLHDVSGRGGVMGGSRGTRRLTWYFVAAGVVLLGLVFGAQATARSTGAAAPLLTTTPTNTFTPTRTFTPATGPTITPTGTFTPVTGPTITPTCCDTISGSGTTTCSTEDPNYGYSYSFDNTCPEPRPGTFHVFLQNAPSVDEPWNFWQEDVFTLTLQPGTTKYSDSIYVDPAPPSSVYYRTQVFAQADDLCWTLSFTTEPQLICCSRVLQPSPPHAPTLPCPRRA